MQVNIGLSGVSSRNLPCTVHMPKPDVDTPLMTPDLRQMCRRFIIVLVSSTDPDWLAAVAEFRSETVMAPLETYA